jgi:hypothetical protein
MSRVGKRSGFVSDKICGSLVFVFFFYTFSPSGIQYAILKAEGKPVLGRHVFKIYYVFVITK